MNAIMMPVDQPLLPKGDGHTPQTPASWPRTPTIPELLQLASLGILSKKEVGRIVQQLFPTSTADDESQKQFLETNKELRTPTKKRRTSSMMNVDAEINSDVDPV